MAVLDVGVHVAGRPAIVGHQVEDIGGVPGQARSGYRAEEPAEGLVQVGDERVRKHQGLVLGVTGRGVGDHGAAVAVPDRTIGIPAGAAFWVRRSCR